MDVLDFLKGIRDKRRRLAAIVSYEENLRQSLLPSGISYDRDKVQTSPADHMLESMAKLSELMDRENTAKAKLISDIDLAERLVAAMPTTKYQTLLSLRYLYGIEPMGWQEVADAMQIDVVYARGRLHGMAIAEARKIFEKIV